MCQSVAHLGNKVRMKRYVFNSFLLQCLGRFESEQITARVKTNEKRVSISGTK